MPKRLALILGVGLLAVLALLLNAEGKTVAEPNASPAPEGGYATARAPRFVTASIRKSEAVLIAGESGVLDIDLSLPGMNDAGGASLRWNREEPPPVLWVSSPRQSGILFQPRGFGAKPTHHVLVRLPAPESDRSVLTAQVDYAVSSHVKCGEHLLWLQVFAPLLAADGERIWDTGVTSSPFAVDTHLGVKLLMLLVVAIAVFLFVVEWVRVDVVAILMMVLLPELGLIDSADTFRGLSSNAVVAIIGVMIISFGLNRVGVVGRVTRPFLRMIGKSSSRLIVVFASLIAAISSVMQNTGAAVLFLPGIRIAARRRIGVPLSRVLMPIGMAAILGGTLTMIGTSPLILLNDLLPPNMPKFGLLELTPIGIALVVFGIAYLSVAAKVSLGKRATTEYEAPDEAGGCIMHYDELEGPFEIFVPPEHKQAVGPLEVVRIRRERRVNIVAMGLNGRAVDVAPAPGSTIAGGLSLLAFGREQAVKDFVRDYGLELLPRPRVFRHSAEEPGVAGTVEVVISPRSSFVGRTIKDISFRRTFGISPLALHQGGKIYYQELADRPLQSGDTVLIHGTWEQLHALGKHHRNFIIISRRETEFQRPEKTVSALASFSAAMALMLLSSLYFQSRDYNPIPLSVCLMIGAVGMVLTRVMTINEAYRAVDWRTVFLLGGLIPLGMAVNQTGTAAWIARGIVGALGASMSPLLLLFVLAAMSCAFTLVISNVGACALLVPLGMSMAAQIGVDPRVAAIVVGIGVSNSFILPTHQVNALYMGPGEYRTIDYVKIGGILSLIYIVTLVSITYFLYL